MPIRPLRSVEGFIAFDLDDCRINAGGTRLAPDVSEAEARLLARAMTYKFATLGLHMGGAKAVVRGAARRGAKIVAISTLAGSAARPQGFDVEELWRERARHGDDVVRHLDAAVRPPQALFDVEADVLIPGARIGAIDAERAKTI